MFVFSLVVKSQFGNPGNPKWLANFLFMTLSCVAVVCMRNRSVTFHRLTETSAVHGNMNRAFGLGSRLRECLLSVNGLLWVDRRMVFTVATTSMAPTRRIMRYSCYQWQPRATRSCIGPVPRLWSSQSGRQDWNDANVHLKAFLITS